MLNMIPYTIFILSLVTLIGIVVVTIDEEIDKIKDKRKSKNSLGEK